MSKSIIDVNGQKIEGDQSIANAFAKYLKNVPSKTKNEMGPYRHPYLHFLKKTKPVDSYLDDSLAKSDTVTASPGIELMILLNTGRNLIKPTLH